MTSIHRPWKQGVRRQTGGSNIKLQIMKILWPSYHDFELGKTFFKEYTKKQNKIDFITGKRYSLIKKKKEGRKNRRNERREGGREGIKWNRTGKKMAVHKSNKWFTHKIYLILKKASDHQEKGQ